MHRRRLVLCLSLSIVIAAAIAPGATGATSSKPRTAAAVIEDLRSLGEPVELTVVGSASTDHTIGKRNGPLSEAIFIDSRVPAQKTSGLAPQTVGLGGSVDYFATNAAAVAHGELLQEQDVNIPQFTRLTGDEYDYVLGPVLLRVSSFLSNRQATTYESALSKAMGENGTRPARITARLSSAQQKKVTKKLIAWGRQYRSELGSDLDDDLNVPDPNPPLYVCSVLVYDATTLKEAPPVPNRAIERQLDLGLMKMISAGRDCLSGASSSASTLNSSLQSAEADEFDAGIDLAHLGISMRTVHPKTTAAVRSGLQHLGYRSQRRR